MPSSIPVKRGRAALLVYGLGGSSLEPQTLVARLREHGFHVATHRIEDSEAANAQVRRGAPLVDFRDWISTGIAAVDRLAEEHSEINLCGIGLGATLALAIAAERSTVIDSLTISSTPLYRDGWNVSRWHRVLAALCYTPLRNLLLVQERPPYGVKNVRNREWIAKQFWGGSMITGSRLREVDRLTRQVRRCLGRVRCPTLMIHAREDDVASLANVDFVRTRLGTDMFAALVLENSYHLIFFDNDCDYAVSKTIRFINTRAQLWANAALTR